MSKDTMSEFQHEVDSGQRFEFGKNWRAFLSTLTDERIGIAEDSIREMLQVEDLKGRSVLDAGSGSGLFSLCARRLGARVHSFDYDPESVACTRDLRARYFTDDPDWQIDSGSVLDPDFLSTLGQFDVVYSWGVLHHTGDMWSALENVAPLVRPGGRLFIALYNDEGRGSRVWLKVKQTYCSGPVGRAIITGIYVPYFFLREALSSLVRGENRFETHKQNRGMSITHDWFDWLGGLPFEVASPDSVFEFYKQRGFTLEKLTTVNNYGINQFVFVRTDPSPASEAPPK